MVFLNSIALWGLGAVSIPIAIHFLNKFRVRRVAWAAMRFLDQAMKRNQRRVRMEDLLLLLLRCLVVALLALAFARPVLNGKGEAGMILSGDPIDAVLLVDDSMSMGMSNGVATRFEQAREGAAKVLSGLAPGSEAALFLVADRVVKTVPEPTKDFSLLRRNLQNAAPSARASDLLPGLEAAAATLDAHVHPGQTRRKEVFVFTDLQDSAWKRSAEIAALREKEKGIVFHLLPVGDAVSDNLAVSALRLDPESPVAGQTLRCLVEVANWGAAPASDIRVTAALDRDAPQAEGMIPRIEPGQRMTAALTLRVPEAGYHSITASIPPDRLPDDNHRSAAFLALEQIPVLVVEGNPGAARVDQEGFFLANALVPVKPEARAEYYLKVTVGTADDLKKPNLGQYGAIFLAGGGRLDTQAVQSLSDFVRRGGGLVVLPGAKTDPTFANDADNGLGKLLPARLDTLHELKDESHPLALQSRGYLHPVTAFWNDASEGDLGTVRFTRFFPLLPTTADKDKNPVSVVAAYSDGQPAIVEKAFGEGKVILFGAAATPRWGNLPLHPAFVPLVQRLTGYLMGSGREKRLLSPGETFVHQVGIEAVGREFSVLPPGEKEQRRIAGRIEMGEGNQGGVIHYAETEATGAYQVFFGNEAKPLAAFAVQSNPDESNLARASDEKLASLDPGVAPKKGPEGEVQASSAADSPRELWLPLLLAAFLGALLETGLAHHFSRSR